MKFIDQARRSLTGISDPSPRETFTIALQNMLRFAIIASLLASAAIIAAITQSVACEELAGISETLSGIFAAIFVVSGFLTFGHPSGPSTEYKVIVHPWSIKELIEVSLTTGTVTIGFAEIILVYLYHFLTIAAGITSLVALFMISNNLECMDSNPFLFWAVTGSSAGTIVLLVIKKIVCCYYMPYSAFEYLYLYWTNFGKGISTCGGYVKGIFIPTS